MSKNFDLIEARDNAPCHMQNREMGTFHFIVTDSMQLSFQKNLINQYPCII